MAKTFPCDKCGICCEVLIKLDEYHDLDDGTGHCKHFDQATHLCKIYDHRPEKCNVVAFYRHYQNAMTFEEYIAQNIQGCKLMKEGF